MRWDDELFEVLADRDSSYFKEYLQLIKSKIDEHQKTLKEIEKNILEQSKSRDEKTGYEYDPNEYLADIGYEQYELEQVMYKSFVVSVFISMEALAADICQRLQRNRQEIFGYKDMPRSGIDRSIKYLKKLLDKHPIADEDLRKRFDVARKIRNALVHADGVIKKEDIPNIEEFIKQHPEVLTVESLRRISLTHAYAESLISLYDEFTTALQELLYSVK